MKTPKTMIAIVVIAAFATTATATHVEPTFIAHEDNNNPTCADFAPEGTDWQEFKIEDPESGVYEDPDGTLNVTLVVTNDGDGEPMMVNWTSNEPVSAVVVKDGSHGHHLYEYDPAALTDDGLTAGPHKSKEGKVGAISHISFCYAPADEPPNGGEPCPPVDMSATAMDDGVIKVNITIEGNFTLMRAEGGGELQSVGSFSGNTTYTDTDTTVGTTYTYVVMVDDEACARTQVTAIPVFPTVAASVIAVAAGALAYLGVRRRR